MSRVKNILVSDVEVFLEELIQELIENKISYVQIENEFHFLDKIYRIYDLETFAKLALRYNDIKVLDLSMINLDKCYDVSDNFKLLLYKNLDNNLYIKLNKDSIGLCKNHYKPKVNKQLIKQQNTQVNRVLNKK